MNRINQINKRLKEIEEKISPLLKEKKALEIEIEELKSGFKVGDVVERDGKRGVVEGFKWDWVVVRFFKKDGTPSTFTKTIFELSELKKGA